VKTFDEALKKVLPTTEHTSVSDFILFYGKDIRNDAAQSQKAEEVFIKIIQNFHTYVLSGQDPIELILETAISCLCIGVAIGIEMEKEELHDNQSEPQT
jgi:hypothetical protein